MIGWLLSLPGAVKRWAIIAGAALLAVLGIYAKGRSDATHAAERKSDKDALQTHERLNNAHIADNPNDARRWLDSHSKRLRRGRKP